MFERKRKLGTNYAPSNWKQFTSSETDSDGTPSKVYRQLPPRPVTDPARLPMTTGTEREIPPVPTNEERENLPGSSTRVDDAEGHLPPDPHEPHVRT